jgi:hypothetical protein
MGSPDYEADLSSYNARLQTLRNAIRADLRAGALRSEIAL